MANIDLYKEVRAVKGRVARNGPHGEMLSEVSYTRVRMTPYMNRLLRVHGDIEEKPAAQKKPPVTPAPPAEPTKSATTKAKEEK